MRRVDLLHRRRRATALARQRRDLLAVVDARRRERGIAVLAVSHDQDLSARVADRMVVLEAGVVTRWCP